MMVTIFISSGLSKSICSWSSFDPGHPIAIIQTPASSSPLTIFFPGDSYHLVSYHHLDSGSFQASSPSLLDHRCRVLTTDSSCCRADRLALSPRASPLADVYHLPTTQARSWPPLTLLKLFPHTITCQSCSTIHPCSVTGLPSACLACHHLLSGLCMAPACPSFLQSQNDV